MLVSCCALVVPAAARAQRSPLHVVVASADSADPRFASIDRGLTLGIEEARRTATLFGVPLEVHRAERLVMDSAAFANVAAWIVAGDALRCGEVRAIARGTTAPLIDAGCADTTAPAANELRVHPPARDSIAALATANGPGARVLLWHHSLERFGADQLNDRFRRRFSAAMDSDAWAAWAAVKIAVEACLRARARGAAPLAVLLDSGAAFDAHKGAPLRFDSTTRRLVQPLYVESGGGGARTIRDVASPARAP